MKCSRLHLPGQLVQVPGSVGLGAKDAGQLIDLKAGEHAVPEGGGGVNDRPQGMGAGNRGEQLRQRRRVGDVAGHDLHLGAQGRELSCSCSAPGAWGPERLASSRWRAPWALTR